MKDLKALILILLLASCSRVNGASVQQMRFHCANDTTKIGQLLQEGYESGLKGSNELVKFYAVKLLGTPYVAHTLEGDEEMLTINIDELDCTTFVETLYALTRTTLDGRYSWRDYAGNLENLRYRNGTMGDYSTRLHYISDWIMDNNNRGNLVEVTGDLPHAQYEVKSINFMTKHKDSYNSLKNDDEMVKRIAKVEDKLRKHRMSVLRKSWLGKKDVKEALRDGDFVGLVTNIEGLDISHLGIISKDESGNIYLLDASSRGGKVMLERMPLHEHLSGKKSSVIGIRVFRMK